MPLRLAGPCRLAARRWLAISWGLALVATGCSSNNKEEDARPKLRVAAASDLQQAMPVLVAAFQVEQEGGIEVDVSYGASGQLAEQVRQGAPFDVFLSANRMYVDRLAKEGSIDPASARPYARGSLVLALSDVLAPKVKSLADLANPEVKKIAIANPETAPYGMAAKQAMERAGLWEQLKPKVVPAESVRQAVQFVQTGNAEVGLVGRSVAEVPGVRVVALPIDSCDPIVQWLGVVARSPHQDDASTFADFLLSKTGQGILRRLGFAGAPGEEPAGR